MILHIDDYGVSLERENASFLLVKGETRQQVSPHRVRAIHVRKPCSISSPAILLAAEHDLPILFFSTAGKVKARLWQAHYGSHARIRHMQLAHAQHPEGLAWVGENLALKCAGQRAVLCWLATQVPAEAEALAKAGAQLAALAPGLQVAGLDAPALRAREAHIARIYWQHYFAALAAHTSADRRSRRPARDPLNTLLNYGYGMLYGEVEGAALSAGLDAHIGILHRSEYGKAAFVFDAVEPFRPWLDQVVAELVLSGQVGSAWFEPRPADAPPPPPDAEADSDVPERTCAGPAPWLSKAGKQVLIPAWLAALNAATPVGGKKIKRRDQIQDRLSALAQHLLHHFQSDPHGPHRLL
jgi:CRISP-associated protein Cas1